MIKKVTLWSHIGAVVTWALLVAEDARVKLAAREGSLDRMAAAVELGGCGLVGCCFICAMSSTSQ